MFSNEFFFKCYIYIYRKYYSSPNYNITGVKKLTYETKLNNFRKKLAQYYNVNALGEKWIFLYCTYQFHRLSTANIMRFTNGQGGGKIVFDDMIRAKSLERYLDGSNSHHKNYFHLKFNNKYKLLESDILTQDTQAFYEVDRGRRLHDIERNRFLNTVDGLSHCIDQGLNYDKRSDICKKCEYKKQCKI